MSADEGSYSTDGLFVCFEGGEGAGKSTQARLLAETLRAAGHRVTLTFEPGDTEVGRRVREIVLDPATGALDPRTEALLYAADKAEHVETLVRPALARGEVVITDRYVDSAIAYQGGGRGLEGAGLDAALEAVNRWATADLRPHLTVLLDVAPGDGLGRFEARDRIEQEGTDFHDRVRAVFRLLAERSPSRYLVLDARASVESIAAAVADRVLRLLPERTPTRGAS